MGDSPAAGIQKPGKKRKKEIGTLFFHTALLQVWKPEEKYFVNWHFGEFFFFLLSLLPNKLLAVNLSAQLPCSVRYLFKCRDPLSAFVTTLLKTLPCLIM